MVCDLGLGRNWLAHMIGLQTGISGLCSNGDAGLSGQLLCTQDGPCEWLLQETIRVQTEKKHLRRGGGWNMSGSTPMHMH